MGNLNLNKQVIRKLVAVWALLSLLIGGIVYYLELIEVDEYVLSRVMQDSKSFDPTLIDYINSPDPKTSEMLQHIVDNLLTRHYVLIDVYDLNQLHVTMPDLELENDVSFYFEKRHHIFPLDKKVHYEKIVLDDIQYFQVLVPLNNSQKVAAGYMEAVYKIEGEVLDAINKRIYRNLIIIMFTIMICMFVLYPAILKLNHKE